MPLPTLPALTLATTAPDCDVLVIGLAENGDDTMLVGAAGIEANYVKLGGLKELALSLGAATKCCSTAIVPGIDGPRVVVVGLGDQEISPKVIRKAVAAGTRVAAGLAKDEPLALGVDLESDDPEMVIAVAEGALLGIYSITKVTSKENKPKVSGVTIVSAVEAKEGEEALTFAAKTSRAVWMCRDWVNAPANILYPETFAADAKAIAKDVKIDVEIMDHVELAKKGYGGHTMVGQGSVNKPRLARLSYSPKGAKFHLAMVGKGMTFDAGGLNLKPADGMYDMKCDMGGAATVLAATRAIADLGLPIQITTYTPMVENMPSGDAYRPSDVLTIYGGKTVENYNTDAEGRLVMADALVRAGEDKPDMIIDCATLTGACVVALGNKIAGLMASDDQTADLILDAAESAGEDFWQLPIPADQVEDLESKIADIKSGGQRMGGAMVAAAFLQQFVDKETPWAHLDIAGPAFNGGSPFGYVPNGGTGHGVRTIVALAKQLADNS